MMLTWQILTRNGKKDKRRRRKAVTHQQEREVGETLNLLPNTQIILDLLTLILPYTYFEDI